MVAPATSSSSPSTDKKKNNVVVVVDRTTVAVSVALVVFALLMKRQFSYSGDPLMFMIPNFLLYTPFRGTTRFLWKMMLKYDNEKIPQTPVPEIDFSEYSYEKLREITENFRSPAVVRGMFLGTRALELWPQPGYLSGRELGKYSIPVVMNATYGTTQADRAVLTFKEAYEEVLDEEKESLKYLFFPVKSRDHFEKGSSYGTAEGLAKEVNEILRQDLDLDRIFPGFGSDSHKVYNGGQMIAGRGQSSKNKTTGTGWHCAPGNNWFIQVVGRKRWMFLDQKKSSYMQPLRNGVVSMMTGTEDMMKYQEYLPVKYADIKAGDLVYNPDWQWHTIRNYEGLSIGCPLREVMLNVAFRNNAQYTGIIIINKIFDFFGLGYGF